MSDVNVAVNTIAEALIGRCLRINSFTTTSLENSGVCKKRANTAAAQSRFLPLPYKSVPRTQPQAPTTILRKVHGAVHNKAQQAQPSTLPPVPEDYGCFAASHAIGTGNASLLCCPSLFCLPITVCFGSVSKALGSFAYFLTPNGSSQAIHAGEAFFDLSSPVVRPPVLTDQASKKHFCNIVAAC